MGVPIRRMIVVLFLAGCQGVAALGDTGVAPVAADHPPSIAALRLEPAVPEWDLDDLVCAFDLDDVDGDAPTAVVRWTVDGRPWRGASTTTWPGDTVPGGALSDGTRWHCQVTATAGGLTVWAGAETTARPVGGNLLLVIADDFGVDKMRAYGEHPVPSPAPTLDALAEEGVLFRNAYATPSCSPTRAALITGRYGSRLGIGTIVEAESAEALDPAELGLPSVLAQHGYSTAHAGKWHLAGLLAPDFLEHPALFGFEHHAGSMNNLKTSVGDPPEDVGYSHWQKNTDGRLEWTTTYATTDTVDDALQQVTTLPEPWFVQVAFNAPHVPLHWPPDDLHTQATADWLPDEPARMYDAMVEAMDTELARLFDGLGEQRARTTIVFLGDNGTPQEAIRFPWDPDRGKGTLYEGGVRVPLLITGPAVRTPGDSEALVHVVDLFPTLARLAGAAPNPPLGPWGAPVHLDGRSVLSALRDPADRTAGRATLVAEKFKPNGFDDFTEEGRTLRDHDYKLVREQFDDGGTLFLERLYDLHAQPYSEGEDRISPGASPSTADLAAYERLATALDQLELDL
ncbi:MAG: arylsulfatase B [Myxococcota bacterium]|jgi:arylsulfatase B